MPELLRKSTGDHSFYAVWKISETVNELLSKISLKDHEAELYNSFVAEVRKKQWLAYRILIRELLKPEDFPVVYDESGKPYLAGSEYHISVSHTEDLAGVIISKNGRVGIDLEMIRLRVAKVRHKFMNDDELASLQSGRELEQMTLVWCAKEALYKFCGKRQLVWENFTIGIPAETGSSFYGIVRFENLEERFELHSCLIGSCMLVYVIE
jgi:4'-phosphopantetheinyl transferase